MKEMVTENVTVGLPMIDPPYQKNFEWEKFDYFYWRQWMEQRRWWCFVIAAIYIGLIHVGLAWMKNRQPFGLRGLLLWWNLSLAFFSVTAFTRTLPEMLSILTNPNGFHVTVCSRDQMTMAHVFYEWLGTWSKVFELGDTAFVILKKQPLIFLHWYHHVSVLVYTWTTLHTNDPIHRWYMFMNSGIHSVMYTYYALRTLRVKMPRVVAVSITSLQILQMIVGFWLNVYSIYSKVTGMDCARPNSNILFALLMYFSYLILFVHFFFITYIRPRYESKSKTS